MRLKNYAVGSTTVEQVKDAIVGMTAGDKALAQFFCFGKPDTADGQDYIDAVDTAMTAISHSRVVLCTPVNGNYAEDFVGGANYQGRLDAAAHIASTYPDNVLDLLQILIDANDGSAGDLEDVANEIVPRSLRDDDIHWNDAGQLVVANAVKAFLHAKGW